MNACVRARVRSSARSSIIRLSDSVARHAASKRLSQKSRQRRKKIGRHPLTSLHSSSPFPTGSFPSRPIVDRSDDATLDRGNVQKSYRSPDTFSPIYRRGNVISCIYKCVASGRSVLVCVRVSPSVLHGDIYDIVVTGVIYQISHIVPFFFNSDHRVSRV